MSWSKFFARYQRKPERVKIARVWPTCPHCKQSMTGSYVGRAKCIRCSSTHRLNP